MDLDISIYLDDEHHISWVYNLQAEAEQMLEKLGYGSDPFSGTGYHVYDRRRDWNLKNADQKAWDALDAFLKRQGVEYTIKEYKPEATHDDKSSGT